MQWHGKVVLTLFFMFVGVGVANAELFVCGDATRFVQYFFRDPSLSRPSNCSLVPDANVEQQYLLVSGQSNPVVPTKYLKVVPSAPNGLAVEMTAQEKQAVEDAIAAANAAANALLVEAATNPACNNITLAQVNAFLDARVATINASIDDIQGVNLTTLKAALHAVVNEFDFRDRKIIACLTAKLRR